MQTRLAPVTLLPELRLHQAPPGTGLFADTDDGYRSDEPPPFWAFAWPGGVALARYVLDHPDLVNGRRVLDIGTGSGIVAIAAARAGAAHVEALDSDPTAIDAIHRNAAANQVTVAARQQRIAHDTSAGDAEVVLVGDAFYNATVARPMLAFLRRAARDGVDVLVSDPGRGFLPPATFTRLATIDVAVPVVLEDATVARTTVWRLAA